MNATPCKIYVCSPLVSKVPLKGIDFIMSNDLAVGMVSLVPELLHRHEFGPQSGDFAHQFHGVFPACAVTRSQSREGDIDLSDTFLVSEQTKTYHRVLSHMLLVVMD